MSSARQSDETIDIIIKLLPVIDKMIQNHSEMRIEMEKLQSKVKSLEVKVRVLQGERVYE